MKKPLTYKVVSTRDHHGNLTVLYGDHRREGLTLEEAEELRNRLNVEAQNLDWGEEDLPVYDIESEEQHCLT